MPQNIYFSRWPSLDTIGEAYHISSLLLLCGVIVFCIIFFIALISLIRIFLALRKAHYEQSHLYSEMEMFYKKQLKLLHGKPFLSSLYQYTKLLVQLHKGKDTHAIWQSLGYDEATIQYIESTIMSGNELDYEQEKRIKDVLHKHIG